MTSKPESQSTEETKEQKRDRLARAHAAHTLNNTAVEVFICMRIPRDQLVPNHAGIISGRQYLPVADLDSSNVVELVGFLLESMQRDALKVLKQKVDEFAEGQADDGDAQVEDGPVHE